MTNQAGIARGLYTEEDFQLLNDYMVSQFREKGIVIADVRHCPHHPEFTGRCRCRKPEPGMILDLIGEYDLDPEACVLIGDRMRDILSGLRAGIGVNYLVKETGRITIEDVTVYKS